MRKRLAQLFRKLADWLAPIHPAPGPRAQANPPPTDPPKDGGEGQ